MPRLTIGMPCYDDAEGVLWTAEALGLYHPDFARAAELIVVDNHPDSDDGRRTAEFVKNWSGGLFATVKYIPAPTPISPALAKSRVVSEATGDIVLCLDCHVLLAPGALAQLLKFYADEPDFAGLVHGPLLYNDLRPAATHFADVWRGEMWGIWATAWQCPCHATLFDVAESSGRCSFHALSAGRPRVIGCPLCGLTFIDLPWANHETALRAAGCLPMTETTDPFPIPGNGMGLFATRRDTWLGFSPHVRGFGGEEMVIHERYRQAGRRTLCHPQLRWWHRFARKSVPYPLTRYAKVRNYVIEFQALGLSLDPIHAHFVASNLMPTSEWDFLLADPIGRETANGKPACGTCGKTTNATLKQPPDSAADIESLYQWACKTPRDLDQHLPKLRELAGASKHVTEITKRRESTIGLLAGRPETLVSYQSEPDPLTARAHAAVAATADDTKRTTFTSHAGAHNGLPVIDETDGLFIDDRHHGERVMAQLEALAPRVRRWIAFHDTATYGEQGDGGGPGILTALRAYLRAHPEWSVVYHTQQQYGLTVISRDEADKPALPSVLKMAWTYAKALAKHAASGAKVATDEVYSSRLDRCALCEQRTANRCSVCGCFLDEAPDGRAGKAVWSDSVCPLARW